MASVSEERRADREVALAAADADVVLAGGDGPAAGGGLVVAHVLAGELEVEPLAVPGGEGDLLEALELVGRLADAWGVGEVELGDLGPGALPGVGDGDVGGGAVRIGVDLQVAVAEGGVGQAVAEREQRRLAVHVVVAVAD